MPVAEEAGVRLAAHPDDPPLPVVRGTARLVYKPELYQRLLDIYPSHANALEFCQGTVAEMVSDEMDVYDAIDRYAGQSAIAYVHFRNVRGKVPSYEEVFLDEGDVDMFRALRLYVKHGYDGVMIPDHTPSVECGCAVAHRHGLGPRLHEGGHPAHRGRPGVTAPAYVIRSYRDADLARVIDITVEGFDGRSIEQRIDQLVPDLHPPADWAERKAREVREDLIRHAEGCFVAVVGEQVVGYVTTIVSEDRLQGRIPNLAVDRRHRNLGIGRALLEQALEDFRARGLAVARIETLSDNAVGHHLYSSLGFSEVVRQVHFALRLS